MSPPQFYYPPEVLRFRNPLFFTKPKGPFHSDPHRYLTAEGVPFRSPWSQSLNG
jgi:hypothetical protein